MIALAAVIVIGGGKQEAQPASIVIEQTTPEVDMKMAEVLIPLDNIEPGTQLTPTLFRVEKRAQIGLDERAITSFEEVHNHYARTLIVSGQPLHQDYITNIKPNIIEAEIPAGFRAVTISVNATASVEGWARPGSRVDVNWTTSVNGSPTLVTLVENAKVLSVDRQAGDVAPGAPVPSTVTLLVTALDSQKIQLASSAGSLGLSLRGVEGAPISGREGGSLTLKGLLNGGSPKSQNIPRNSGTLKMGNKTYFVDDNGDLIPLGDQ